jgi:hypothetical protein
MVQDIAAGSMGSDPGEVIYLNGRYILAATTAQQDYRLKLVDKDGGFSYTRIISLTIEGGGEIAMVYPNPVLQNASLMIGVTQKEDITCYVLDLNGRAVIQKTVTLYEGSNSVPLATSTLPAGYYTIFIKGVNTTKILKIIKE